MRNIINKKDAEFLIFKIIEDNPSLTQRQISEELGLSLGKTNFLIHALVDKGFVKLLNFKRSNRKLGYTYLLTSEGIIAKAKLASDFLERKSKEYNILKEEIDQLKDELYGNNKNIK